MQNHPKADLNNDLKVRQDFENSKIDNNIL